MTHRIAAPLPWLAGLLAIYLIAPLVAGAQQAGSADWNSVDTAAVVGASAISIGSATTATLIIAIGGIPLGYLLARLRGWAVTMLGFLVQLPLALPPLASGVLLLFLVGYTTPLGRVTNGALTDSFAGIVLAEVFVAAPFLIIAARSAFGAMDTSLEGVAATLGRSPLYVFLRVSMPIARPAILSGLLLAWLRAFGEFGATVLVAYHPYSLPVYTYVAFGSQGLPAMLPILVPTLVLAVTIMVLSTLADRHAHVRPTTAVTPALASVPPTSLPRSAAGQPSVDLKLRLERKLGTFHLDIAWAPRARHLAIVGPSGAGKSMTLRIVAGIESYDRGSIVLNGEEIGPLEPAARNIGYVPQNYALFPHLTVVEQLAFPAGADPALANHWLDRLGLRGLEQRAPAALSLGQQQRVALARALVRPCQLLLLDEPFSALDAPLRTRLRREMRSLQNELEAATIIVTHDPAEAAILADEILVCENGHVLQSGPTEAVFRRPTNETVARLLGADRTAEGNVIGPKEIAVGAGAVLNVAGPVLTPGAHVGWTVSPSFVRLSESGRYNGVIETVTHVASGRQITILFGDTRIDANVGFSSWRAGSSCRFDIDADAVRVWPMA